jgi:hypothetical protein
MNDLLINAELDYRINRIREDWRPIRARRQRKRDQRRKDAALDAGQTWIG